MSEHQKGYAEASEYYIAKIKRWLEIFNSKDGNLSPSTAFDRMHIEMVKMEMEREVE